MLATGSRPAVPPVPGLREAEPWTNREATVAQAPLPGRLAVLGGGPVGCELADAFSALGVQVTLIGDDPSLLEREEPFAGEFVAATLRARGVELLLGAELQEVRRPASGAAATLQVVAGGAEHDVEVDEILVAAGRTANADDLGLDTVGVSLNNKGHVEVDTHARVSGLDWLYAVGDLESQAGSSFVGKGAGGRCRFIVDEDRGVLAGVTFAGPGAGELLHAATIAIAAGVPVAELWHTVAPFPTRAEIWLRFLEAYDD